MIEVNEWLFWGICAMAAIGVAQAVLTLFSKEPEQHWTAGAASPPGEAPAGFRWVLVREENLG